MFEQRLRELAGRIDGALALSLVAADGIAVETVGAVEGLDLEELAAELLAHTQAISEDQKDLEVGVVRQLSITTDRHSVLVSALSSGYYLLLVLDGGGGCGRARFELRRALLEFEGDLV